MSRGPPSRPPSGGRQQTTRMSCWRRARCTLNPQPTSCVGQPSPGLTMLLAAGCIYSKCSHINRPLQTLAVVVMAALQLVFCSLVSFLCSLAKAA